MKCPRCHEDDIIVATKEKGDVFVCVGCRAVWDEDMEVLYDIPENELRLYEKAIEWNTLIDNMEIQLADAADVEQCLFCDKFAVKDGNDYKCHSCGGSWSVI
jgi:hypothetical protein